MAMRGPATGGSGPSAARGGTGRCARGGGRSVRGGGRSAGRESTKGVQDLEPSKVMALRKGPKYMVECRVSITGIIIMIL